MGKLQKRAPGAANEVRVGGGGRAIWTKQRSQTLAPEMESSKRKTKGRHFGPFVTSLRSILKGARSIFPLYLRLTKMQGKGQYFKRVEMITIAKRTARLTSTKTFFRDSSIHINEWSFSWSTFCAQGGQLMRKTNRKEDSFQHILGEIFLFLSSLPNVKLNSVWLLFFYFTISATSGQIVSQLEWGSL